MILLSLRYTFVDILRAILLSLESMIEDPELQVNGFILIIDWSNFTFKQASKLTPSMLRLAIEGLQVGPRGGGIDDVIDDVTMFDDVIENFSGLHQQN